MAELLVLLMLMFGADFSNAENVLTPEYVEQVTTLYQERYEDIQEANVATGKTYAAIYVGDQRILDMEEYFHISEKENRYVVADAKADIYWLKDKAYPQIEEIRKEHPEVDEWTLVMNVGLNDFYNAVSYTEYYKTLLDDYNICVMNVMPIKDAIDGYFSEESKHYILVTNDNIKMYNNTVNGFVNDTVKTKDYKKKIWLLATYNMVENKGYTFVEKDDTHTDVISYDKDTYEYVYNFVDACLDTYYLPSMH